MLGKMISVVVPSKGLYKYRQGAMIQDAFPNLSAGDREFLISGISNDEFDKMFSEDES